MLLQIARHAMWRDELNAWGIVLDSASLSALFAHLHYEGHPGLWHLLLWLASHLSTAPQTLQIVHALIGLGIVWMIALVSPFSRTEKILILLSYFVLFEYTVISRNYGIGLLLALVFAHRRSVHPDQLKSNAVLLGFLANTNVFALILAAALALEYAWFLYPGRRDAKAWITSLCLPAGILLAFAGFSIATFWPASDISWRTTSLSVPKVISADEIAYVVESNVSALMPIDVQAFWFSNQGPADWEGPLLREITLATLPFIVVIIARIFIGAPRLLVIPAVTLLGSVAFNLFFYEGSIRHWGINFVAFLAALWILRAETPQKTPWALPILVLNAAAGVLFTVQHWTIPFSNAGATAEWITSAGLRDAALIGTPDTHVAPVAELLGRRMTFLDCECSDTYLSFSKRRDDFSERQIPERLLRAVTANVGHPTLYLNTEPATADQKATLAGQNFTLVKRAAFTNALVENFYVYEVVSQAEARSEAIGESGSNHAP